MPETINISPRKFTGNVTVNGNNYTAGVTARPQFTVNVIRGRSGYQWEKMTIEDFTSVIENPHFKKELGPLMIYKGAPLAWEEAGITQDKVNGTLDTFLYGEMKGLLRYQYR